MTKVFKLLNQTLKFENVFVIYNAGQVNIFSNSSGQTICKEKYRIKNQKSLQFFIKYACLKLDVKKTNLT